MKNTFKKIIVFILEWQSRLVLRKYKPKIIAITGNIGKTSAKDAVYAVLSKFYFVRKSHKSFNSEIGIPLTILGVSNAWQNPMRWIENIVKGFWLILKRHPYPEYLVLEIGADAPGDIQKIVKWIYADVVVFTRFGDVPVHVEFFKSPEQLFGEKSNLMQALTKDGMLLLNADDQIILKLKEKSKNKTITFGFAENATVKASNEVVLYKDGKDSGVPHGVSFRIDYEGHSVPVVLEGVFGKNHIYSALVALSIAYDKNLNMLHAIDALKNYEIAPGRMRLIEGVKESEIIDDTYNSSPLACETALSTLGEIKTSGKKFAILGDMLELGKYTTDAHKNIGMVAAKNADIFVTVGPRAKFMAEGALDGEMDETNIFQFDDSRAAGKFVEQMIAAGDVVLIKGSQGMRMERAVEEIMAHPEDKEKLLVRQEEEWLKKV